MGQHSAPSRQSHVSAPNNPVYLDLGFGSHHNQYLCVSISQVHDPARLEKAARYPLSSSSHIPPPPINMAINLLREILYVIAKVLVDSPVSAALSVDGCGFALVKGEIGDGG